MAEHELMTEADAVRERLVSRVLGQLAEIDRQDYEEPEDDEG